MASSSIEWTELTWNPTTGCDKLSAWCKFCYAEIMSRRLKAMGVEKYKDGFAVHCHNDALALPKTWRKPSVVFVNAMSDLFVPPKKRPEETPGTRLGRFLSNEVHPAVPYHLAASNAIHKTYHSYKSNMATSHSIKILLNQHFLNMEAILA
jgi:hypothetical protein